MMTVNTEGERLVVSLEGELTVHVAADLKVRLGAISPELSSGIDVDLSKVEALDAAGAQLLFSFRRHVGEARTRLVNVPAHIESMLRLAGFGRLLGAT